MSIYKREESKFWWYKINIPGSKPRRFLRGSTGTEDKQTAAAIENTLKLSQRRSLPADQLHRLIDALAGVSAARSGIPLQGIVTEYRRIWSIGGKRVTKKTQQNRIRGLERLLAWIADNRPATSEISEIDKMTASAYSGFLKRSGIKSKTRKNIISELSAVWHIISTVHDVTNPWKGLSPEVDDSQTGKAFSRDEEIALLNASDSAGHDWGLMCRVARMTGLRYGDIAALSQANIDRTALAIRLVPSKTSRHKIAVVIPITQELLNLIPDHPGPLFAEAFECLPRQMWRCPFATVLEAAGLAGRGYTFHSWRHTFRTRLSEAGVPDDIARRLGGWTQNKTAQRYDHAERLDEMRKAIEASQSGSDID